MNLPYSTSSTAGLVIAGILGLLFGLLLQKGRVTDYNVIVNFFRLRDLRVFKIMLTAVVVGGLGVFGLMGMGMVEGWHIKANHLLGVSLGAAIFGVGMALYGYCPGTGVAAIATGSKHALVGFAGMIVGGIGYAYSYPWLKANVLSVGDFGKQRLPDLIPLSEAGWYVLIAVLAVALFFIIDRRHLDRKGA